MGQSGKRSSQSSCINSLCCTVNFPSPNHILIPKCYVNELKKEIVNYPLCKKCPEYKGSNELLRESLVGL